MLDLVLQGSEKLGSASMPVSVVTESLNGRGWKGPLWVTQSRLHRTTSRWILNISREGDSTASLGSLGQCSVTLRGSS